jgi:hypothetical protein
MTGRHPVLRVDRLGIRLAGAVAVAVAAVALVACSPTDHSVSPTSTVGQQTTLDQTHGYTCHDPVGDISLDPKASGKLTQPAGIDLVEASALVKGDALDVTFTTAGPIESAPQPQFFVQNGDPSTAPSLSFLLATQPTDPNKPAGTWNVALHTYATSPEKVTDLAVPVTVSGNSLTYQVPLSQIPSVVSLQWEFGSVAVAADSSKPFDDCNSFTAASTTTSG